MYGLKRSKQDGSGVIKGAGTGTSDDIQKNVPAGTYIMPADSTQKLGARNIKNLGQPSVPVNVSNGEYELPPEQVHAVGVQALNQMKDATHTDVPDQQGFGLKQGGRYASQQGNDLPLGLNPEALANYQNSSNVKIGKSGKPELFFANGGDVPSSPYPSADDIRRAQQNRLGGPQMRDVTPIERQLPASNTTTPSNGNVKFPQFNTPTTGQMLKSTAINSAKGLVKGNVYLGAASALFANAATPSEQYRERFGLGDQSPEDLGTVKGFAKDFGVRALGYASDLGNALTYGQAGRFYADKQRIAQEAKAAQPAFNQQQNNNSKTIDNPFGDKSAQQAAAQQAAAKKAAAAKTPATNNIFNLGHDQPQNQQSTQSNPYAIQQKGNSFSYSNPAAAAQAHAAGIPELQNSGFGMRRTSDPRGVANLLANTREMGPNDQQVQNAIAQREASTGNGGGFGARVYSLGDSGQAADTLQKRIDAVSQSLSGSRGLTASQRNQIVELQNGFDNRANDVYKTDANNAAALQREAMGQAGANYRADLQEGGQNNRYFAGLAQDTQKFNATNDLANRQFGLEQSRYAPEIMKQRAELNALQRYDQAKTPEERQAAEAALATLRGQVKTGSSKDDYVLMGGGQRWDEKAGTMVNLPQQLFNTKTQQFVNSPTAASSSLPSGMTRQVGTSNGKPVYEDAKGNRFIGN